MRLVKIGQPQQIELNQSFPETHLVTLTAVGENGNILTDSSGNEIKDIELSWSNETKKCSVELTFNEEIKPQYIRLYFEGNDVESKYYPEDAQLLNSDLTLSEAEIVPVQYFVDYLLGFKAKLTPIYQKAISSLVDDRDGLRSLLRSAENDLELSLEMYIRERTVEEKRDNFFERFSMNLWQFIVSHPPINDLVDVKVFYGNTEILGINKELFTFDRKMGIIEFMPLPSGDSAGMYSLLLQQFSGVGLAILHSGYLDRMPNMFRATYKTGLYCDQADRNEKEGIRKAVARRALIDIKKFIDPRTEMSSKSESIDGSSGSQSWRVGDVLKSLQDEEDKFIKTMQKRYAKGVDAVVA